MDAFVLSEFTSKFTVKPLIVATESVSDGEEFENICFLLNNGWSIGDGSKANKCMTEK
jgi:hypothetical protein